MQTKEINVHIVPFPRPQIEETKSVFPRDRRNLVVSIVETSDNAAVSNFPNKKIRRQRRQWKNNKRLSEAFYVFIDNGNARVELW